MNTIDHTKSTPGTIPLSLRYDDNLGLAAREAREVISEGTVGKKIAAWGRRVDQLKALEDTATRSKVDQSMTYRSDEKTPIDKNRTVSEMPFSKLPPDMKMIIYSLLNVSSLRALTGVSQEMYEITGSDAFVQNKILHDFVMKIVPLIGLPECRNQIARDLAVSLVKSRDIDGIKEILLLTESSLINAPFLKIQVLHDIAVTLAKNNDIVGTKKAILQMEDRASTAMATKDLDDMTISLVESIGIAEAKEIVPLIESSTLQMAILQAIAVSLTKSNDIAGAKATICVKEFGRKQESKTLKAIAVVLADSGNIEEAKATALSIRDKQLKSEALHDIAVALAKNNNITGAEEIVPLIENPFLKSQAPHDIAVALAKNNNITGAEEIVPLIEDVDLKYQALHDTVVRLIENNDIDGAEVTALSTENVEYRSKILEDIAVILIKNGETARVKEYIVDMKKMRYFYTAAKCALKLIAHLMSSGDSK